MFRVTCYKYLSNLHVYPRKPEGQRCNKPKFIRIPNKNLVEKQLNTKIDAYNFFEKFY